MSSGTLGGPGAGPSMADLDHSDLGPNVLAAAWTTWTIALIFVLLRFYTRARIMNALGLADWFIALSLIAAAGFCVCEVEQVKHGLGKHFWDVDLALHFAPMTKAWWVSLLCYVLSLALTKVSICLLYLTIFTLELARRACCVVLAMVVVHNLWATAMTLTHCIPLEAVWDLTIAPSFCQPQEVWWVNTALIIATDIMIFLLPIPFVLPLRLPRRQKLVVVGIFAVGFFVVLVSFIRLAILIRAKNSTDFDSLTFGNIDLTYWTVIEVHTAIVVACTMTLKPLVAKFFPNVLSPRNSSGSSKDEGPSATGSDPPLTIGSKPSRQLPPVVTGERYGHDEGVAEEVMLGNIEQQRGGGMHDADRTRTHGREVEEKGAGEVPPAAEKSMAKNWEVEVNRPRPWARICAVSERTEDLGREVTARSIS
ncbi:hypothetical protein N657DRAFT_615079 [Parathielavia appendiculata]|uniref:Rhodopsin domain-containing protein n=1 Tax=Parathielavia appendiculata TaxID=2587402 RepID=A0AAN6U4L9_9PEZI|nr:hypothetical protein N657DRAFT_615079 [Parathielavia appendiculata]